MAIATHGLTKRFGDVAAVDGVDLDVPAGSVYGFLGPNGSGKTTTIRMLLGLIEPSAGTWELLGRRMPAQSLQALAEVGALIEGPAFYPWLSGRDNLARLDAAGPDGQRATRAGRIEAALGRVGLTAAATKKYRAYSLGMRQRLGLAAALLRPRHLLVLDEPTNGMDPQGTREIRNLVAELAHEGTTVFLSSHLLAEVEQICTHVGVMSEGHLLTQGTLTDLRAAGGRRLRVEVDDPAAAGPVLGRLGLGDIVTDGDVVTAKLDGQPPEVCNRDLVHAGIGVRALSVERPSLEDLFVSLTGEGFDVAR
ncbi:ABC transporter ATP-binding protein [Acidiferrimicrobium sp. IK]|nr:ABC transporter ATP-binding protein [Acidiferrimicrobium sp. IK]MCU4186955.1 ABC transporter ATP-binding protein [Acidiferrimicrobium sp. IK]